MHHYLNLALAFITQHSGMAYGAIFLVSFSESLALVGLLMPGTMIMFGIGAVVATGSLGLAPVLLLAMGRGRRQLLAGPSLQGKLKKHLAIFTLPRNIEQGSLLQKS
jgi:hypothetical protein